MDRSLSTELALRAFDADAAFSAALAEFQAEPPADTIAEEARRAAPYGFSWFARPSEPGFIEVRLRHKAGAEIGADGESTTALLAGLLGYRLAHQAQLIAAPFAAQASESEQEAIPASGATTAAGRVAMSHSPVQIAQPVTGAMVAASLAAAAGESLAAAIDTLYPSPVQAAAESLAAATGGAVVTEPSEYVPDPDEAERARLAGPLTDEQKAVCIAMLKGLTADQRKAFTISFRDAFRVPREAKAIAPLVTEVRHMEFCDRWSIEAAGGVAP